MPEKTLPALTLIKIYTIFGLVLISILILITSALGIGMLATMHLWAPPEIEVAPISVLLIVAAMAMILSIIFYFVPAFKILKDMRKGILHNNITTIRGIKPFTIATYIIICLSFIKVDNGIMPKNRMKSTKEPPTIGLSCVKNMAVFILPRI